jgi:hypothetical protein
VLTLAMLTAAAQQLPQFSSTDYDGWTYNNPGVELNATNIADGKITLYVNKDGLVHILMSPLLHCEGIDTIAASVKWYTRNAFSSDFDLAKSTLTLAIDDADGHPLDSITAVPSVAGTANHTLSLSLPVPCGLGTARLRLVSWTADVNSCGAVKKATFTAITSGDMPLAGDVDGDGQRTISDVTAIIDLLLTNHGDAFSTSADVDQDGNLTISDVTALIDLLLTATS